MKGVHQYPIHLLTPHFTRKWYEAAEGFTFLNPKMPHRQRIANYIIKLYPGGAGVATSTLMVVALIKPGGKIEVQSAPYKSVRMDEVANKPALPDCQCFSWFDNLSMSVWKDTPAAHSGKHHPLCQFLKESHINWKIMKEDRIKK